MALQQLRDDYGRASALVFRRAIGYVGALGIASVTPTASRVRRGSGERGLVFEPGHVICIEIRAGMAGGIEDMYAVEPDGVRRISLPPREIRQIGE